MYISEEQINAVVKVLEDNEVWEGMTDDILKRIAINIIEELNKVIYNGT